MGLAGRSIFRRIWSRRLYRYPAIFLCAMVVLSIAAIEVTSQSWFCNSCHMMGTYYRSWQTGTHSKVDCVSCHIPPGVTNYVSAKLNGLGQVVDDLLHRTSSKPSASVSDFACTRSGCHELEKVRSTKRREGRFFFDHSKHIGLTYHGIEMHCTTCHAHVQGDKHFETHTNTCITCHLTGPGQKAAPATAPSLPVAPAMGVAMAAGSLPTTPPATSLAKGTPPSQCQYCHKAPDKPIQYQGLRVVHAEYLSYGAACESCHRGVTAETQKMRDDQCYACHEFGTERMTDSVQMHRVHLQGRHKIECFSCHGVTRHGPSAQSMRLDQFDCRSCHVAQHAIQQKAYTTTQPVHVGPEGAAVTPMFLAHVDCTGCHVQQRALTGKPQNGATVAAAPPEVCDRCHKPGMGREMVPLWQKNTRALYEGVLKLMPTDSNPRPPQIQQLIDESRRLLETVRLDGSWGVHNPRYTQKLLEDARFKLLLATEPTTRPASRP